METGAITQYVDVAQIVLYMFWAFFAGLIYYLLRENHREGYPMDSGRENGPKIEGWPPVPEPKAFDDTGRDGDDVLQRATDLHSHHVAAAVQSKRVGAEFLLDIFGRSGDRRRHHHRRR